MLEDRDYMRQPDFGGQRWRLPFRFRWTWTTALLAVNAVVFVVECIVCGYPPTFTDNSYFALSVEGIKHYRLWQFLTFQFLHAGFLHIFFNSWAIFVFGRLIEDHLGGKRFLTLYFTSGVIGGVVQVLGGYFWPGHFGTAVIGASAGAMGLMTAFAVLYPEEPLILFLYFIPVKTRAKYLVWGIALLSVLGLLFPVSIFTAVLGGNVANGAHLGGMAMGWLYVKFILGNRALLGTAAEERHFRPQPEPAADQPPAGFQDEEVDAVLDKISARGINSLTARERAVLEAARKKMARH